MAMNFDKAMYREKELLNLFSVPKSTFHRWVSQYIAQGYDPIDMGKITIGRNTWWDAYRFYEWMIFQSQNNEADWSSMNLSLPTTIQNLGLVNF